MATAVSERGLSFGEALCGDQPISTAPPTPRPLALDNQGASSALATPTASPSSEGGNGRAALPTHNPVALPTSNGTVAPPSDVDLVSDSETLVNSSVDSALYRTPPRIHDVRDWDPEQDCSAVYGISDISFAVRVPEEPSVEELHELFEQSQQEAQAIQRKLEAELGKKNAELESLRGLLATAQQEASDAQKSSELLKTRLEMKAAELKVVQSTKNMYREKYDALFASYQKLADDYRAYMSTHNELLMWYKDQRYQQHANGAMAAGLPIVNERIQFDNTAKDASADPTKGSTLAADEPAKEGSPIPMSKESDTGKHLNGDSKCEGGEGVVATWSGVVGTLD